MNKKPLQIISLGAGVQSTALMIMAERGEITPKPDFAILKRFEIALSFFSGNLLKYSPALMPNTEIPFISAILTGREGILPPAKPMMRNLPPHFIHFMELLYNRRSIQLFTLFKKGKYQWQQLSPMNV